MTTSRSIGIAVVRVTLGVVMLLHGVQKFTVFTVAGVQGMLDGLGLPMTGFLAVALPIAELLSGALLILGLLTRAAGVLAALVGLGALFTMHLPSGFFVDAGGYEFVLLIAAAGVALALLGGGRYALDTVLPSLRDTPDPA
jgi:putative oxidoreductase